MKPRRIPSPEERAAYDRISKQDAATWNAARTKASQTYIETMKLADQAFRSGAIDQAEHIRLMVKAFNKCEAAENKANRESHLVMVEAWNRYILGMQIEQKTEQLALW